MTISAASGPEAGSGADAGRPVFRAGLVQMCSGRDVAENVAVASALVREAASKGCHYVQTPEVTTLIETNRAALFAKTEPESGHAAIAAFSALARELGIWVHIGSMGVLVSSEKVANRAYLFRPDGAIAARYDKIHMFDVQLEGGERYRESRNFEPGTRAVLADLPWGRLGITICYDLRFPNLYQSLAQAGAQLIAIPAAFTVPTGAAHWHALLRARAIETQCFVLAAAQAGEHESGRKTYGHSIIVSPWGDVLAEGDGVHASVIVADVDLAEVGKARRTVPSLEHGRPYEVVVAEASGDRVAGR